MNIEIKRLHITDMDILITLRMEVLSNVFCEERKAMTDGEWTALREANRSYYQEALEKDGHIACLALADGKLAGCGGICLYREMPSPDNISGLCGYLMNIYTREQYRSKGVAKAVCRWLINEATVRGTKKIYLETSECGRALYHSLGFHEMKDYLKL